MSDRMPTPEDHAYQRVGEPVVSDAAAALVTDEMILATTLIGTEDMVRTRLRTWRDVGVDTVRPCPAGDTLAARLDTLGRAIDLVRALG